MNLTENLTAAGYFPERGVFVYHQPIKHFTYGENYNGYYKSKDRLHEIKLPKVQKDTQTNNTKLLYETKR